MSRILIVDDAVASREAMARLLTREGHEVACARNGAEGMVRLKQAKPDLVLLDQMMPEVDGLTFLAGMRRFPKWKNLPVIMLTGLSDRPNQMRAEALGVCSYLLKTQFDANELIRRVEQHTKPA